MGLQGIGNVAAIDAIVVDGLTACDDGLRLLCAGMQVCSSCAGSQVRGAMIRPPPAGRPLFLHPPHSRHGRGRRLRGRERDATARAVRLRTLTHLGANWCAQATLADLEDLCSSVGLKATASGCMGACGSGSVAVARAISTATTNTAPGVLLYLDLPRAALSEGYPL